MFITVTRLAPCFFTLYSSRSARILLRSQAVISAPPPVSAAICVVFPPGAPPYRARSPRPRAPQHERRNHRGEALHVDFAVFKHRQGGHRGPRPRLRAPAHPRSRHAPRRNARVRKRGRNLRGFGFQAIDAQGGLPPGPKARRNAPRRLLAILRRESFRQKAGIFTWFFLLGGSSNAGMAVAERTGPMQGLYAIAEASGPRTSLTGSA